MLNSINFIYNRKDLSKTHFALNFEVIVRKKDWNLGDNDNFELAMEFHVNGHGEILLPLEFQPSR